MPHRFLLSAALLACFALGIPAARAAAQQTDVIRGRVTNGEGLALPNVRVTATSIPGNVTREARTSNTGNYQIVFPDGTGDYMMGFALIGYIYRQGQVKRLADEDVLVANVALDVVPLDTVSVVASVQRRVNRNSETPDVGGTEREIDPAGLTADQLGDVAAMAASLPGVLLVPGIEGNPDAFSVLGLDPSQNSITLNGLPIGPDGLPRDASVSTSLATSPYDASRGGFSGANFNISTGGGSNFRTRGTSLVLNAPQLQWTDRAGRALGNEYANVSVGGRMSGPIVYNKSFYNVSYQLGRQSRDNQSLLTTNPVGLVTAGIAPDSVARLTSILQNNGVPGWSGLERSSRLSDNGSLLGSVTVSPPSSTSGQSVGFTARANWSRQSPVFGSPMSFASASGDRTGWSGGVQARHSAYLKMVLTETSAGLNLSRNTGNPYLDFPAARVRVTSTLPDASGVQSLTFGGNPSLSSSSRSTSASLQNTLSWFDDDNKHRVKLTSALSYSGSTQDPSSNLLGTFTFNSLEDLEAGIPESFTRTLSVPRRDLSRYGASIALGDSYRRTQDLQLQYGVRVDATRHGQRPEFNPAVLAAFARRNDRVPTPMAISPRVGFSWTVGETNEIRAFFGQARRPRAVIRGGIGFFASAASGIGGALENTGLPSGTQRIMCVGPAVPSPDWTGYTADPTTIPEQCADGSAGSVFSNSAPNVTLYAPDFTPPRSVRSNLSWNGQVLDGRFRATIEGTYAVNLNQRRAVDLNFDGVPRFTLDVENRPVFVDTSSIVAGTGSIAARDARISDAFARVSEVRSDLRSRTAQLSLRLSPISRRSRSFGWSGAYTFTDVRQQVSGFSSTAGNPLAVEWARSSQGPHQVSYNLSYRFFDAVHVSWSGQFRSGGSYTPMVSGDVNGDGYNNDRAFIHDGATAGDSALRAGMSQLMSSRGGAVRRCLESQVGQIAARNSCRAPWSSTASLNLTLDRAKFRMPQRASVSFSLSNPLGAADLLVNGSQSLRGWGATPAPDATLLYVRGFDAQTRSYQYEVNPRFGETRPRFMTLRSPVVLTISARFDLGATRERQMVEGMLERGRTRPGTRLRERQFRTSIVDNIPYPMWSLLLQQDTLKLTTLQADSLAVMNRSFAYRSDSIWASVASHYAALGGAYDFEDAYARFLRARRAQIDLLMTFIPAVNALLTPEQRRRLPPSIVNGLDPRYLRSIRDGTNSFVSVDGFDRR